MNRPRSFSTPLLAGLTLLLFSSTAKSDYVPWNTGPILTHNTPVQVIAWNGGVLNGPDLVNFIKDLVGSKYFGMLHEYSEEYAIPGLGVVLPIYVDNDMQQAVSDSDIQTELARLITHNLVPGPGLDNTLYVIAFPGNPTTITINGTALCALVNNERACGYHNSFQIPGPPAQNIAYAIIPACGVVCGGAKALDAITITASHEIMEAVTDPLASTPPLNNPPFPGANAPAWIQEDTGQEISDLCTLTMFPGPFSIPNSVTPLNPWAVQGMWSDATGNCVGAPSCPNGVCTGGTQPVPNYQQAILYQTTGILNTDAFDSWGNMTAQQSSVGWPHTLTNIVPGSFGGPAGNTDLFVYDRTTGNGWFETVSPAGAITQLRPVFAVGAGYSAVIPGNFDWHSPINPANNNQNTGLLFYTKGQPNTRDSVKIYDVDNHQNLVNGQGSTSAPFATQQLYQAQDNNPWDIIQGGDFNADGCTDLLLYRAAGGGQMVFYTFACFGGPTAYQFSQYPQNNPPPVPGLQGGYTMIAVGNLSGVPNGRTEMYAYIPNGPRTLWQNNPADLSGSGFSLVGHFTTLIPNWTIMQPGEFGGNDMLADNSPDTPLTDLLFYTPNYSGVPYAATEISDGVGDFLGEWSIFTNWPTNIGLITPLLKLPYFCQPGCGAQRICDMGVCRDDP